MSDAARIDELRKVLNQANFDYYVDSSPTMADSEYDTLLSELETLEAENPDLFDPNSPTQRIGGEPVDSFEAVKHALPMQSIDNTYTTEELQQWYKKLEGKPVCTCDPKIDGVAISLRYEHSKLKFAVTRGDGEKGDDVTAQVKTIRSIPLHLRGNPPTILEVRGEIYMPNTSFEEANRVRAEEGEPLFANARNATAGTLKSLNPKTVSKRKLTFLAHGRGEITPNGMPNRWSSFVEKLREFGIPASQDIVICDSFEDIVQAVESFSMKRETLGFGVDGMVVRVDSFELQEQLGSTSKAPRWCIAFKYPAKQGSTRLLAVDWQVGKNGTLTPRATMEPIFLAGTTVQHATLHNIEEIHRKDIRVGDEVTVEKAGEIIPQVVSVKLEKRDGTQRSIKPPADCPTCSGPVEQEGPKLFCVNPECPAQFREKVKWFAARDQMDIDGLGDKVVDQLIDAGLVCHFADLYTLSADDLMPLEGFAEKSAVALVEAIEESKTRGLARVLSGVGIRLIGRATAKMIAKEFDSIDSLLSASMEQLVELPDVGHITAETLYAAIHSQQGVELFSKLSEVGVSLLSSETSDMVPIFDGKVFVITGSLQQWDRKGLTETLERRGAKVTNSVSTKTDVLITGEKAGSKLTKANNLGVEVWDEQQLSKELSE